MIIHCVSFYFIRFYFIKNKVQRNPICAKSSLVDLKGCAQQTRNSERAGSQSEYLCIPLWTIAAPKNKGAGEWFAHIDDWGRGESDDDDLLADDNNTYESFAGGSRHLRFHRNRKIE